MTYMHDLLNVGEQQIQV